jgi:hypothetical protein
MILAPKRFVSAVESLFYVRVCIHVWKKKEYKTTQKLKMISSSSSYYYYIIIIIIIIILIIIIVISFFRFAQVEFIVFPDIIGAPLFYFYTISDFEYLILHTG